MVDHLKELGRAAMVVYRHMYIMPKEMLGKMEIFLRTWEKRQMTEVARLQQRKM